MLWHYLTLSRPFDGAHDVPISHRPIMWITPKPKIQLTSRIFRTTHQRKGGRAVAAAPPGGGQFIALVKPTQTAKKHLGNRLLFGPHRGNW